MDNAVVYWVGEMATRGIQFAALPVLGHLISAGEYGAYAAVGSLIAGFVTIAPVGTDAGVGRYMPGASEPERRELGLAALALSLVTAVGVAIPLVWLVPGLRGFEVLAPPASRALFGASLIGGSVGMTSLSILRSRERSISYAVALVVRALVMAFVLVSLWAVGASGAEVAIRPLLWSWAAFGVLTVTLVLRPAAFRWTQARRLFGYGILLVPHLASHWVLATSDRLLMQALGRGDDAGRYAFMYQISMVVYLIGVSLNNAWAPRFMAAETGADATGNRAIAGWLVASVGLASVALAGLAPLLMTLVSSGDYAGAELYAPVLGAAFVCATAYLTMVNPLLKAGRTAEVSGATLSWAALNLGANVALIPRIGAWGPATVTLATYAGLAVTVSVLLGREGTRTFVDVRALARSIAGSFLGLAILAVSPVQSRALLVLPSLAVASVVMGLHRPSRLRAAWSVLRDRGDLGA